VPVDAFPRMFIAKKLEVPVKRIPARASASDPVAASSLVNPESLELFGAPADRESEPTYPCSASADVRRAILLSLPTGLRGS
jgi:hypothetical protein